MEQSNWRAIWNIFRFARPHVWLIVLAFGAIAGFAATEGVYLVLMKPFIKAFLAFDPLHAKNSAAEVAAAIEVGSLRRVAWYALALAPVAAVLGFLEYYLADRLRMLLTVDLRNAVCRAILPQSLSFAGSLNPTRRLGFNLGLTLNPWSGATITRNDSVLGLGYKNVWRGSIGAEYDIDSLHPVRVGYSQQTWYYEAGNLQQTWSTPITEDGVHLGTSIPIPKFGSLDVSGEVLFRNSAYLKEVAGRLMLTLSYSEAWAKRTRRWGY